MHTTIIREGQPDRLHRQVWEFWLTVRAELCLQSYEVQQRSSTRHHWVIAARWSRLGPVRRHDTIKAPSVPLPEDVMAEAMQDVMDQIRVLGATEVA